MVFALMSGLCSEDAKNYVMKSMPPKRHICIFRSSAEGLASQKYAFERKLKGIAFAL